MANSEASELVRHDAGYGVWQRTSPLAALFFFGRTIKALTGNALQLAGTVGAGIVLFSQQELATAALGVAGVLAALALIGVLRFWFFRFRLDADGVRIRQGVLRKSELNVQFDRIQGIDVAQSPIDRLLDLATVTFDTAGSAKREGQLPAVPTRLADALRARIDGRRDSVPAPETAADASGQLLLRLDGTDMVRIGLTDRSVLFGLAFLPVVIQQIYMSDKDSVAALTANLVDQATAELAQSSVLGGLLTAGSILLGLVMLLLAATTASAFLRFHDFELRRTGGGFRSRSGLLTRREVAVEATKIQQLRVRQSLVMGWLRRFSLQAMPAVSGIAQSANPNDAANAMLKIPLLDAAALDDLRRRMFAGEDGQLSLLPARDPFIRVSPVLIRARLVAVGIVPAGIATIALMPWFGAMALWCLTWIPVVGLASWQRWRRLGYMHNDDGLASRSGLLAYRVDAFLMRKAQAVAVTRSPLQRRKGLANLEVSLASGSVVVPYVDFRTACRLRDYMLYKAESCTRPWH